MNREEEWEKEFDKYVEDGIGHWISVSGVIEVKCFIRSLLQSERKRIWNEVEKETCPQCRINFSMIVKLKEIINNLK